MTTEERLVLQFAQGHFRQTVGHGECWDLAEQALASAHAQTSRDLQDITYITDYVWGTSIPLTSVQPGDIIQFAAGFSSMVTTTVVTDDSSGTSTENESSGFDTSSAHTAVIERVGAGSRITVLHQNSANRRSVQRKDIYFSNSTTTTVNGNVTTTIVVQVSGTVNFYRPNPSPSARRRSSPVRGGRG